ncbi:MAG: ubiquinone biosynthesis protein UbiE [Frankiales bacterium]|nr:ubiquinone biosynthesis protein UbiE [Frankiales bacterium]
MSGFSALDESPSPESLLDYLDATDDSMAAFKAYIVAAAHRYVPGGRVLDLGCGVGHDLLRLSAAGLVPLGLDSSRLALERARQAGAALVQADGARIPLQTDSVDGCRVERVLQHVEDPGAVLDEILRVVRPGGFLAVLEPDHTALRVDSDVVPSGDLPARCMTARHPGIGSQIAELLRRRSCVVDDIVTELSFGYDFDALPFAAAAVTAAAVLAGKLTSTVREAWLHEQRARSEAGEFRASWLKVLVVARTPG